MGILCAQVGWCRLIITDRILARSTEAQNGVSFERRSLGIYDIYNRLGEGGGA